VTLIELIVAIAVLGIATISILGVLSTLSVRSAETLIRGQGTAIASSYLNEALAKSYGSSGATQRALFTAVGDYNGLNDNGVHDQRGNAVNGLGQFQVAVTVGPGTLGTVPAAAVRRVDVAVSHPSGVLVSISGYRTLYP
jgi:type II secretory pathway pseudopilin PulG